MSVSLVIFALAIALAFAAVRWLFTRLAVAAFWIDFFSMLAAVLVLLLRSFLGVPV